jgi:hypothetical protein
MGLGQREPLPPRRYVTARLAASADRAVSPFPVRTDDRGKKAGHNAERTEAS